MLSQQAREHLATLRQRPAYGAAGNEFNLAGLRAIMGTRVEPADPAVVCQSLALDGMPCEWVVAPGADPSVRLLYLHGGGYVSGTGGNYLPLAAELSAAAQCAVLLPDYRLAPEHPFPAGLEDCVRAHEWMRQHGPNGEGLAKATFVSGDSAGGGLTLATLLALRAKGLPLPQGAMPLSAFADLTMASESIGSEDGRDPIMSAACLPIFVQMYLGEADARLPLASPVFGDWRDMPPLLIQVGEREVIRDDSVRVAEQVRVAGGDARLEVWADLIHVFQVHGLPESREAVERLAAFMRECLARKQ